MRRPVVTLALLALTLFPGGCGVHVGNGMKSFRSQAGGYTVQIPEQLSVREARGGMDVSIDNSRLASGADMSTVNIVTRPRNEWVRDRVTLLLYANQLRRREANGELMRGGFDDLPTPPGTKAAIVMRRERPGVSVRAQYWFLLNTDAIVSGEVDAKAPGQGLVLIAPLLNTFRGD